MMDMHDWLRVAAAAVAVYAAMSTWSVGDRRLAALDHQWAGALERATGPGAWRVRGRYHAARAYVRVAAAATSALCLHYAWLCASAAGMVQKIAEVASR